MSVTVTNACAPITLSATAPSFVPAGIPCNVPANSNNIPSVMPSGPLTGTPLPFSANDMCFNPSDIPSRTNIPAQNFNQCSDFAKFLLKKDLVFARLSKFDDHPEIYLTWKRSFKSVMGELGINPSEELDLLVKYLGPQSHEHAVSIRASNACDHSKGIERIWRPLDERYGSPEAIEAAFKKKLDSFPKLANKDNEKLYVQSDILSEIESVMDIPKFHQLLSYFNTSSGVIPIVSKLPPNLQGKWTNRAAKYKRTHDVPFTTFHEFCEFIREMSTELNDPGFSYTPQYPEKQKDAGPRQTTKPVINVKKTDMKDKGQTPTLKCPLHDTEHSLNECRGFRKWSIAERKKFIRDNKLCYKCCVSDSHISRDCTVAIQCDICGSQKHSIALHPEGQPEAKYQPSQSLKIQGGEHAWPLCTELCGSEFARRSCGNLLLTRVYRADAPQKYIKLYALLDDQSNRTLARSALCDAMQIPQSDSIQYILSTCAGRSSLSGRKASGLIVESLDDAFRTELPTVIEYNQIPIDRQGIHTPDVIRYHKHLREVNLPPHYDDAGILLFIGRDLPEVHHILDQRTGPRATPFAQKLRLGWVVIGNVCLGKTHPPRILANVNRTILENGRPTIFETCEHRLAVEVKHVKDDIDHDVFVRSGDDERIGYSIEDNMFLDIMDHKFSKTSDGNWIGPLPFRSPQPRLPIEVQRFIAVHENRDSDSQIEPRFTTEQIRFGSI